MRPHGVRYEGYDIITLQKEIEREYTIPEPQTAEEVISYCALHDASRSRSAPAESPPHGAGELIGAALRAEQKLSKVDFADHGNRLLRDERPFHLGHRARDDLAVLLGLPEELLQRGVADEHRRRSAAPFTQRHRVVLHVLLAIASMRVGIPWLSKWPINASSASRYVFTVRAALAQIQANVSTRRPALGYRRRRAALQQP